MNGGVCYGNVNTCSYSCLCPSGFSGKNCEVFTRNECITNKKISSESIPIENNTSSPVNRQLKQKEARNSLKMKKIFDYYQTGMVRQETSVKVFFIKDYFINQMIKEAFYLIRIQADADIWLRKKYRAN